MSSILSQPISKVSQLLHSKSLSVCELTQMCLDRISKIRDLNAFITVTQDLARDQAELLRGAPTEGPLFGIPVSLKDNWSTRGVRTTCASRMLRDYVPPYDATVVRKLLRQRAVLVGKTNLDEFAMGSATVDSYFGPTKNPWRSGLKYSLRKRGSGEDITNGHRVSPLSDGDFFVAGGSSGGSAVSVATGACFAALGSDTGGSTRCPAAHCGVVGLKPTYGRISRQGLVPLANSLDVPGIVTRSVQDAALLLNALSGHDPEDSTTVKRSYDPIQIPENVDISQLRIGIPKEYDRGLSDCVRNAWHRVADLLSDAGARVEAVSLPHTPYSIVCYSVLCCADVASNFARYDGLRYGHRASGDGQSEEHQYASSRREGFGDVVRERILAGNYFLLKQNYAKYFLQAAKVRRLICADFESVFRAGVDLLLTPVTLGPPALYSEWVKVDSREHNAVEDYCTQPANMAGLPAISVPCCLSEEGLPLSLQLIGRPFDESSLLHAASFLEQQMDFPIMHID